MYQNMNFQLTVRFMFAVPATELLNKSGRSLGEVVREKTFLLSVLLSIEFIAARVFASQRIAR